MAKKVATKPILAAGGIVVRDGTRGLFAVVQRSKDNAWVLPRGKLKRDENPVSGARREVVEETGHRVRIYEFLGAMTYRAGGRPKVVQFWRMEAEAEPSHALMADISAVEWLPLKAAVRRLSYPLEKLFLRHIGRQALPHRQSPAHVPPQPPDEPAAEKPAAVKAGKASAGKGGKSAGKKAGKKADKAAGDKTTGGKTSGDKASAGKMSADKASDQPQKKMAGRQHPRKAGAQAGKGTARPQKTAKPDKKVRRKNGTGPARAPHTLSVPVERPPSTSTTKVQTAAERKGILQRMLGRLGR